MIKYIVMMVDQRGTVPFMGMQPFDTNEAAEAAILEFHTKAGETVHRIPVLTINKCFVPANMAK